MQVKRHANCEEYFLEATFSLCLCKIGTGMETLDEKKAVKRLSKANVIIRNKRTEFMWRERMCGNDTVIWTGSNHLSNIPGSR